MSKFLFVFLSVLAISGCQSYKPPMPTGKWTTVNLVGFIPPNVAKFSDEPTTIHQPTETTTATVAISQPEPVEHPLLPQQGQTVEGENQK